ncbi:MAG: glucosyl-3-phosphoglycerate synthase [Acidimicrobiales bacterium]
MPAIRTFHHAGFDVADLVARKGASTVSVCLPARDEARTVGAIVQSIRQHLVAAGLVDVVVVIDDHSTDGTADVAADAGARVVTAADVLPEYGEGHGKGEALWKSLHETDTDLVAWCDADIVDFGPQFVVGLLGPLLTRPDVGFVKGFYDRPGGDVSMDRGGRVTELVARPVLSLLFPHLTGVVQPLSGEYAGRRSVLERLPFVEGYGVDIALLIDVTARFGLDVLAQVDLGERRHRNRPLDDLSPQATAILQTTLRRAGWRLSRLPVVLRRPGLEPLTVDVAERPPLVTVPSYRPRSLSTGPR